MADPLQDPVLELHDSSGTIIAINDNWKDTQQAKIEATGLAPTDDRESALEVALGPGAYTAIGDPLWGSCFGTFIPGPGR